MRTIFNNWRGGTDRRGAQAPADTGHRIKGFWPWDGNLRAAKSHKTFTTSLAHTSTNGSPPWGTICLGSANQKLFLKSDGLVYLLNPSGATSFHALPLWSRGTSTDYAPELFAGVEGWTYFTPTLGHNSFPTDACVRWAGHAAMGSVGTPTYGSGGYDIWPIAEANILSQSGFSAASSVYALCNWRLWLGKETAGVVTWGESKIIQQVEVADALGATKYAASGFNVLTTTDGSLPAKGYNRFCIVDASPIGICQPPSDITAVAAAGAGLADGTYNYICRYVCSSKGGAANGWIGNPCIQDSVTLGSGNNRVSLTLPTVSASDPIADIVDQIEVFRAGSDGIFRLVQTLPYTYVSGSGPWYAILRFNQTVTDTGWTAGDTIEAHAYWHERPTLLRTIQYFNGRLYSADGAEPSRIKLSTAGAWESFPEDVSDVVDLTEVDGIGGSVQLGDGQAIIAMVPEEGSFSSSGITGSSLLVFKSDKAFRWRGSVWSDFDPVEVFQTGCQSAMTVQNCDGIIYWLGADGVYGVAAGGSDVQMVSRNMWPDGFPAAGASTRWTSAYWRGRYVLADYPNGAWMMDAKSRAWVELDSPLTLFAIAGAVLPSTLGYALLGADSEGVSVHYFGDATDLLTSWVVMTKLDYLPRDPSDLLRLKRFNRVFAGFINKTGKAQTISWGIYGNSHDSALKSGTATVPWDAANPLQIVHIPTDGLKSAYTFQVGLWGTLEKPVGGYSNPQFSLEWVLLDYEHAAALAARS